MSKRSALWILAWTLIFALFACTPDVKYPPPLPDEDVDDDWPGEWHIYMIDSGLGEDGGYTSIALDSSDRVHISYYDATNGDLEYATNASGSWKTYTIDSEGDVGKYTSIAIDSNDHVHISYWDWSDLDLKYATNASGSWATYMIDLEGNVGKYTSTAIDADGYVHISYVDITNNDLKYATNRDGGWIICIIDSGGNVSGHTSLALGSEEHVHVSYLDYVDYSWRSASLKYAVKRNGSWAIHTIDAEGNVGEYTSLALDSDEHAHISYLGNVRYTGITEGDLKYATNKSGSWQIYTIASEEDIAWWISLTLDSNGYAHISYYDGYLKYATNRGRDWNIYTIDRGGNVGPYSSIATDSSDMVHISYHDWNNGDLKYATNAEVE